ncbi:TonB-dependent receptor [Novosphingobium sp.]|uniref:TonB-dependent receptor domain-containing protein n=1 Tax=Novosphingobium sp. TaxID=1874826 RepID=UPI0025E6B537|nr:TonB-dependent receptor [Novosphingobium sp.]MCC6925029.1 TonB-dependent receptor [Novosphingobium sp.]
MKFFRKSALSGATCLQSAVFVAALVGMPGAALAQDAAPADSAECVDENADGTCDTQEKKTDLVVTGSRIARPNLTSAVPITSIGGQEFTSEGQTNIGDTLNELPQLRSTFSQQNPGLGIGIAGLNLLDLRGLGTSRTLVLVNGRRHVPADILNNAVSPDINSVPNDLIDRVDIVTGGNSAVYGSDAIAGVVNFVLRRNYSGLQMRASAGVMEGGWGAGYYASAMYGKNFADGRGNITLHGEYSHQDRVFASQIDWLKSNDAFVTVDLDTGGLTQGSDGWADTAFMRDIRSSTIHRYGLIPINQRNSVATCGRALVATNGAPTSVGGNAMSCTYIFTDTGNMVEQTGTRMGTGINSVILGGNGQTGRETELLSVIPRYDRVNFNMLAHYQFSDAAEVFLEAKWNRVIAQGSAAAPSFTQGTGTQFDFRERLRIDNPFMSATDRATLSNAIIASGCNPSLTAVCGAGNLTAGQVAQIGAGTYRYVFAKQFLDVGIRDEHFERDTYRIVGGLRGTFNDDWNYEISLNYGKFKETTIQSGYVDRQRFMLSIDSGINPLTNQIECRAKFDPASALILQRGDLSATQIAALNARLAADISACVPYNPFGAGVGNAAAAAYFGVNASHTASLDQLVVSASLGGDTSGLIELPGGPIKFAIGGEYRREKAFYEQDPRTVGGYTNAVVIPTFAPDPFEVKEAYGEVLIPLLADMPFFHELTLSGAARVAKYQGGTGTVWAYNGGAQWAPVDGLMFRGNYARAVRAPNVSETAFPLVPNFAPGFSDPCRATAINSGSSTRAANCAADLGGLLAGLPDIAYSLPIVSGSNPNLQAEKSSSWTFGLVFEPKFVPGLSLTVDYYDIKVNNIIASVGAQGIVNACYDQPTLANVFCAQFSRWRGPGVGTLGEQPGQLLGNSLINAPLNYAARVRRGVDTQITYRKTFSEKVKLSTNLIWTHNLKISNYQNATFPTLENPILGELGDPKDEWRWDTDLQLGRFTLGYRVRYIGPMVINAWEDFNVAPGACNPPGSTACPPFNSDLSDTHEFPKVFYHDIRFEFNVPEGGIGKNLLFFFGINNVFDKHPPLGSTATGVGSAIYDYRGRNFYSGVRARF